MPVPPRCLLLLLLLLLLLAADRRRLDLLLLLATDRRWLDLLLLLAVLAVRGWHRGGTWRPQWRELWVALTGRSSVAPPGTGLTTTCRAWRAWRLRPAASSATGTAEDAEWPT